MVREQRLDLVQDKVVAFGRTLRPDDEVVLEATGNTAAIERLLRPFVGRVVIANPRMVRAIAYARVKTDKIDAITLACLQASGFLPEVWAADDAVKMIGRHVPVHCSCGAVLIWKRVGLADIDAPELNGRCEAERRLAADARDALRHRIGGQTVAVQPLYSHRFVGTVAHVSFAGTDLGAWLMEQCFAEPWPHDRGRALAPRPQWCGSE